MRILKTNLYMQKPSLGYCTLNSLRTVFDYYKSSSVSRQSILKSLKTVRGVGTTYRNLIRTLNSEGIKYRQYRRLSEKLITATIDRGDLMLISYASSPESGHSSVISGYKYIGGVLHVHLTDSWLGKYTIPLGMLKILHYNNYNDLVVFKR
jgi:hypothetical protein